MMRSSIIIECFKTQQLIPPSAIMSQFRAAKLDIGCFAKIRNIRDHTKRKVYSENEPERYAPLRPHVAQELTMT